MNFFTLGEGRVRIVIQREEMITSLPFKRLVTALKLSKKTLTVVEQCCGGLINASIMAQPGASSVFYGGSVAYNTRMGQKLLLNDANLHTALTSIPPATDAASYIQSKLEWTARSSVAVDILTAY